MGVDYTQLISDVHVFMGNTCAMMASLEKKWEKKDPAQSGEFSTQGQTGEENLENHTPLLNRK